MPIPIIVVALDDASGKVVRPKLFFHEAPTDLATRAEALGQLLTHYRRNGYPEHHIELIDLEAFPLPLPEVPDWKSPRGGSPPSAPSASSPEEASPASEED